MPTLAATSSMGSILDAWAISISVMFDSLLSYFYDVSGLLYGHIVPHFASFVNRFCCLFQPCVFTFLSSILLFFSLPPSSFHGMKTRPDKAHFLPVSAGRFSSFYQCRSCENLFPSALKATAFSVIIDKSARCLRHGNSPCGSSPLGRIPASLYHTLAAAYHIRRCLSE